MSELATGKAYEYKSREGKKGKKEQVVDKKKGKKWQIVIKLPKEPGKKNSPRKYHTFYGSARRAEDEKNKLVLNYNEKLKHSTVFANSIIDNVETLTFGEYAKKWLKETEFLGLRNTWEHNSSVLENHIIPKLGHILLTALEPHHISQYKTIKLNSGRLDGKPGGLAKETVNKHLSIISVILDAAADPEKQRLIDFNPAILVKRAKGNTSKKETSKDKNNSAMINCVSAPNLNILLHKLEKLYSLKRLKVNDKNKPEVVSTLKWVGFTDDEIRSPMALFKIKTDKLYPIVYLAARTGMRRSELLALKWNDINFQEKYIKVHATSHHGTKKKGEESAHFYNTTKEGKVKPFIRITDKDIDFLKQHRKDQLQSRMQYKRKYHDNNLVFCNNNGTHLRGDAVGKAFSDFIQSNYHDNHDFKNLTLHGLRHTHCTLLILAGVPIPYVAQRVGHQNTATTEKTYTHVEKGKELNLGDVFEKLLEENAVYQPEKIKLAEQEVSKLLDAIGG